MAIVKASYTRSRGAAKANVRYITHRPGNEGEKISRQLFGFDGQMTKDQAYNLIGQSMKGTYFYRLKLSTDPKKENWDKNLDLEEVTKEAVRELERKLSEDRGVDIKLDFAAAIHDDHTDIRHVHVLAFTPGKLDRPQLKALTAGATQEARHQRKDLDRTPRRVAEMPRRDSLVVGRPNRGLSLMAAPTCPRCDTQMSMLGTNCVCSGCGLRFNLEPELSLGREGGRQW
jgi:hypothetical protein